MKPRPLHILDSDDAMESRKNIFITGCSQGGIGAALARAFHNRGHRVIASARDPANTGGLQALGIDVIALNVCDARSIQEAFEKVRHLVGMRLDVLVNNAGIGELFDKLCPFP
jgi:1-acylglycerone phosphate reductase